MKNSPWITMLFREKLIPILIFLVIMAVAGAVVYSTSSLSLDSATAKFSKNEDSRHMNTLTVTAPYGYFVIRYDVVPRSHLTEENKQTPFRVGGYSFPADPMGLYEEDTTHSNMFPSSGIVKDIPLETHVRISSNLNTAATAEIPEDGEILKGCGTYLFVTKQPISSEKLETIVESWSKETVPGDKE